MICQTLKFGHFFLLQEVEQRELTFINMVELKGFLAIMLRGHDWVFLFHHGIVIRVKSGRILIHESGALVQLLLQHGVFSEDGSSHLLEVISIDFVVESVHFQGILGFPLDLLDNSGFRKSQLVIGSLALLKVILGSVNRLDHRKSFRFINTDLFVVSWSIFVLFELGLCDKGSSTTIIAAGVSSLAFVLKEMVSEGSFGGELEVTLRMRANERSFLGMDSHVVFEGISSFEGLVAAFFGTGIRSVVGMNTLMSNNGRFEAEDLSTVREGAFEDFLVLVATFLEEILSFGGF
jgi:hypothetical protein